MCLWKHSDLTFWPAPGNVLKCVSGSFLSPHFGLRLDMLENARLEAFLAQSGLRLEMIKNVFVEAF